MNPSGFLSFEEAITAHDFRETAYCGLEYAAQQLQCSPEAVRSEVASGALQGWLTMGGFERIALTSLPGFSPLGGSEIKAPLRLLVVEDDASTMELYRCQFEQWNLPLDCTWMDSAVPALMDIASMQPQLLITDLSMPGLDGLELLRGLHRNPRLEGMQIVVISGWAPEYIAQRGALPPSIELLRKPVDFDWLRRYVTALVDLKR